MYRDPRAAVPYLQPLVVGLRDDKARDSISPSDLEPSGQPVLVRTGPSAAAFLGHGAKLVCSPM